MPEPAKTTTRPFAARAMGRPSASDPRHFQIAMLTSLLLYGVLALGFPVDGVGVLWVLAGALGTQAIVSRWTGVRFDPRSAAITALSLALLLRTSEPWMLGACAAFAVASKFLLRARGKHVFNPSALALAAAIFLSGQAWLSPGQWGSTALFAFAIAGLGALVVFRAERSDVTWAFAGFWCAFLFARALWIGEPASLPLHRLQDGALLLFTFFMISDPKTTPDSRLGRIVFAGLVAGVAYHLKFNLHVHAGLVYALVLCAPTVFLIDRFLPGRRYAWPGRQGESTSQGASHENQPALARPAAHAARPDWIRA